MVEVLEVLEVVEVDVEVVEDWRWMCSGSGLIQHEMLTCRL